MIYHVLFFTVLLFSFLSLDNRVYRNQVAFYFIFCFFLVLFVGLRYASVDYFSYQDIYNNVNVGNDFNFFSFSVDGRSSVESGFAGLILLTKYSGLSFYHFIFLISFVSLNLKFYAFKELSPFLFLTLLIYVSDEYLFKDMGQIRNAMASGLVLLSIIYIYQSSKIKFICTIVIAASIHVFAYIALPLYFVRYFNNRNILIGILVLSIFIAFFGGLGSILVNVAEAFDIPPDSRLVKYIYTDYGMSRNLFSGTVFFQLFWCLFCFIYYDGLLSVRKYNFILIPILILSTSLMLCFIDYGILFSRIREMLYVPVQCVLLPSFVLLFNGNKKLIPWAIISGYCFLYLVSITNWSFKPYNFLFFYW